MSEKDGKLKALKQLKVNKLDDLPIEYLNYIYLGLKPKKQQKKKVDNVVNVVDKTTDKYKVALKFINKLLKNIDKKEITDLTEFVDIDRLDIIKEENKIILEEMKGELFKEFDKHKCRYYYKKGDNYMLNIIRGLCKELKLSLTGREVRRQSDMKIKIIRFCTIKNI
jgi:hypothetical protein